jgi:tetratricopeptide (TPR) repeat protein
LWILGEYQEAKQLHQEMVVLCRETGDQGGLANSSLSTAVDASGLGEYEEAKQLFQASLALFKEIGDPWGMAGALGDLGELFNMMGEYAQAARCAQESLSIYRKITNQLGSCSLRVLGNAACGLGNPREAREYFHRALEQNTEIDWVPNALLTLVGVAALLAEEGEKERATELLALVLHHPLSWQMAKDQAAPLIARFEAELSPHVVTAARARGKARNLDATLAELLVELGG